MMRAATALLAAALAALPAVARAYDMCLEIDSGLTAIVVKIGSTEYSRASLAGEVLKTCSTTEASGPVSARVFRPDAPYVSCNEFIPSYNTDKLTLAIRRVTEGSAAVPPTIDCVRLF